ncbi:helix-turn-helix protein [Paraburkholderia eburnea]|uniref:Helix-turn-helix protein n=1 Tax=Paraburkholderia eburnea TaxID=1189126 RepID=A0A2S4MIF8_9BURK|nr:helix-turn-helix transcriptional regulator [Paraburkholderia eburnea]POR54544.1 helix-turn-helix protein [Paraburkholderia eburnea]PRZ19759.1 helix-turn-helix protein [Paraburkholderia eburnea]
MDNPEFGRRARSRRESLKLSQKALAERVGVSQPAIAKIEAGGSTSTTVGFALAAALETTLEWLEFGDEWRNAPKGWKSLDSMRRAQVESYIGWLLSQESPQSGDGRFQAD